MTAKRRPRLDPAVRAHYARIGRKGGRARAAALTAEERSEIARAGAAVANARRNGRTARREKTA